MYTADDTKLTLNYFDYILQCGTQFIDDVNDEFINWIIYCVLKYEDKERFVFYSNSYHGIDHPFLLRINKYIRRNEYWFNIEFRQLNDRKIEYNTPRGKVSKRWKLSLPIKNGYQYGKDIFRLIDDYPGIIDKFSYIELLDVPYVGLRQKLQDIIFKKNYKLKKTKNKIRVQCVLLGVGGN